MKKFLSLLLAVMMLLSCLPAMAEAGTFTANADKYMITAYKGSDENLFVPASVDGVPTPIINWQTINGAKKAVTLTLEEGITQIRSNNIASLNITQLTLPSTLEVIANNNIYQTDKLTEVTVPAAVSYVGTLTFSYCDVLTKVTFTGLCPVFGPRTFVSTAKDLVVYVPDDQLDAYKAALPEGLNIQSSGKNAVDARVRVSESDFEFDAATGTIKKYNGTASYIEIPATIGGVQVKTIGQKAFYQHPYMTVVIIPEGVETLEMYSIFAGSGLYRVELPSTLKTIGNNALWGAELDSVKLPEGLEKIGDGAFTNGMYSKVEELIIPDSVTSIGKEAFKGCTPIKIIIGANVQSLSEGAFGALNYVEEVVIRNTNGMTIDPKAFQSSKKGATITLMDGITEEVYNSYVVQLAVAYESATVNQPELAVTFPKLDAEAGAPYIGNWFSVAGKDVMGDFTDYYPATIATLNADGTGYINMDGDEMAVAWFVNSGYAIIAPMAADGSAYEDQAFAYANIDENGRLFVDFGYIGAICEQEGATYAAPAIPELPWPEFDLDNAKYFIGQWEATEYIVEGESYPVELIGPMAVTLNDDGSALLIEGEEEPYELRWYAEYAVAYMGETMSDRVEITFDGNGNIKLDMIDVVVILSPKAEEIPAEPEAPEAPAVESNTILGNWDDGYKTLDIYEDGRMDLTYKSDGYVNSMEWAMVDGVPTVTKGMWKNIPIKVVDGLLIIEKDTLYQEFERVGAAPDTYVGAEAGDGEDAMPEAQPIGAEGAAYFGVWNLESMMGMSASFLGMTMDLTLNEDGTCSIFDGYESDWAVWTVENGVAMVDGAALTINADGALVMNQEGMEMIFVKADGAASSAPAAAVDYVPSVADDFIGGWICKADPELQILLLEGEANLIDGGELYTVTWSVVDGVAEFDGMKLYITENWTTGILDMYGDLVEFERGYVEKPKASAVAPSGSDDDEMTDEELLALLALLGQLAESDDAELPENLKPYVGTWHMVYIATGGLEGDLRPMGITAKLELNADGTGKLSGAADDSGKWYDDEGTVRFGKADTALVLLDGGFLRYGSQLAGYMVFSQDATASWTPAPAVVATAAPVAPAAPQAPVTSGNVQYVGQKFICKTYTTFGMTMDASMLGAEYSLKFAADNTAEFTMAGFAVSDLPYTVNAEGVYVINYYGTMFNCVPTATGFDMDYYGTMTMHFVPAE